MGTTYSNCQVRSDSQDAVANALKLLLKEPAYISPSVGGWVGVYPDGDADKADKLAQRLSAKLACGVFFWSVYDSDIFFYTLYESGARRDEFDSNPDYFESVSKAKKARLRGKPEALVQYCLPGVGYSQVQEVLHPLRSSKSAGIVLTSDASASLEALPFLPGKSPETLMEALVKLKQDLAQRFPEKYTFAEEQAGDLAKLLGIAEDLGDCEFREIADGRHAGANLSFANREFRLVGGESMPQEYKDQKIVLDVELMRHPEKMQDWIRKGANPNARDNAGVTILFRWAEACFPEQVAILLKAGADVNAETDGQVGYGRGMTALIAATGRSYEQPGRMTDTVKLLIEAGADVNARTESGRTALSEALTMTNWQNHKRKLSRAAPEDVLRKLASWSAEIVEMLRAAGATE